MNVISHTVFLATSQSMSSSARSCFPVHHRSQRSRIGVEDCQSRHHIDDNPSPTAPNYTTVGSPKLSRQYSLSPMLIPRRLHAHSPLSHWLLLIATITTVDPPPPSPGVVWCGRQTSRDRKSSCSRGSRIQSLSEPHFALLASVGSKLAPSGNLWPLSRAVALPGGCLSPALLARPSPRR
jgi:hypothetical protein